MTALRRITLAGVLAAAVAIAVACQEKLPTAPGELTLGIVLYEDADFSGKSSHLMSDASNLADYEGPCEHTSSSCSGYGCSTTTTYDWDDCISSIRVAPGWHATIYRDHGYQGESFDLTADAPNLRLVPGSCPHDGLNDCVSSIKVGPR